MSATASADLDTGSILRLPVLLRDFDTNHANFENPECGQRLLRGMVADTLGPGRRPISALPSTCPEAKVQEWFSDHALNRRHCRELPLRREPGAMTYAYDAPQFFPLDDRPGPKFPGDDGVLHNFHFCLETRAVFEYRGGERLIFKADDDIFVFVNNKLAIDLGGNHGRLSDLLELDMRAEALGLRKGNAYPIEIFYCDRATSNAALGLQLPLTYITLPESPQLGPLRLGDRHRNALGDTLVLHAEEGPFTFTALRATTITHHDGCVATVLPRRQSALVRFDGLGVMSRLDSALIVNSDTLKPGTYTLTASQGGDQAKVVVVVKSARLQIPTANPRSSVGCGPFRISLHSPDSGAVLWYTTGSQPFSSGTWQRYMQVPIEVNGDAVTLRFVAVKNGYAPSEEGKEIYVRDQTETPVLLPPGEAVSTFPAQVRLAIPGGQGQRIRYRLTDQDARPDAVGEEPIETPYDPVRGITLTRPGILTAVAQGMGCRESDPLVASLGMPQLPAPAITPASQVFWPTLTGIRALAPDTTTLLFVAIDSGLGQAINPDWRLQPTATAPAPTGAGLRWGFWGPSGYTARHTVTVRAMAHRRGYRNSPVTERRYALSDLRALSASFKDIDGDGRIETGEVRFDFPLPRPPRMQVRDPWQGGVLPAIATLSASNASQVRLRFAPLPVGTGFVPGLWMQIAPDSLYPAMALTVTDSAMPVLLSAESHPQARRTAASGAPINGAEVTFRFSEPVIYRNANPPPVSGSAATGSAATLPWPFFWTRPEAVFSGSALLMASSLGERAQSQHAVLFDPTRPYPAPGDSLWPRAELRDAAGLSIRTDKGVQVQGEAPMKSSSLVWRPPKSPTSIQAVESGMRLPGLVLTDAEGLALLPNPFNHAALAYQGPLLSFPVEGAGVQRIHLKAFDHLGQAVNAYTWQATVDESRAVQEYFRRSGRSGEMTQMHLRWTPISSEGRAVATGVYILWGEVEFAAGTSRDAYGQPTQRKGGRASFGPMRIGVIRE